MQTSPTSLTSRRVFGIVAAALISAATVYGQPVRTSRRVGRAARQEQAGSTFTFGDITLSRWRTIRGMLTKEAIAEGPNTTVDAVDEKTGTRTHATASKITATLGKKGAVDRIEMSGGVKFNGERPVPKGKGTQLLQGSGSTGVYYKSENRVVLSGPVDFYVEQPGESGKQWVRGSASEATYDDIKRLLVLTGSNVRAQIFDPESMEKPSPVSGIRRFELDMKTSPYTFHFEGPEESTEIKVAPKSKPPKKEKP